MNDILDTFALVMVKIKKNFINISKGDKVDKHNINCDISADGKCKDSEKVMGHSSEILLKF